MAADTRKEKRAPVSLKVRFKSATVDEFIEQYSVDISVGGLFIKTKSPMPIGTLLKFEFQLKDESRLIHGVGRVVWKRDENEAKGSDIPAGMGIKFIKMDAESRALVDKIVSQRGEAQSSFDMVPPEIQSSMPPPGEQSVITIRPAAPAVPQEALRSPIPSAPPPVGVPKAAQRYKSTLAFDASALPTPQPSRVPEEARPADAPPAPAPFFPSTTPEDEMPDEADRTNIRPASEIKAQAEAAENEAARHRAELEARMEEARNAAREHGDDEDVGRVTMPESDVRKAARAVSRPLSDEEQRAALRKAAEEEARAERRAAAQRADVSHATHAVPMMAASTPAVNEDPSTEAPTLPPAPLEMAPEIGGVYGTSSHKNDLPPLDFDDHQVTPVVGVPEVAGLDAADDEDASESSGGGEVETNAGVKKKKKKKKNKRGESMRPQETPRAVRISGAPPAEAGTSSATGIEKASDVRKGPRLSPGDSLSAKKAKSTSKTLPIVLSVVAIVVAIGVYMWSSQSTPAPEPLPPPNDFVASPTPTPSTPPPSEVAVPEPTPPSEAPVAVATSPVRVVSVPSGASIRFADADHGVTPATLELPDGVATSVTVTAPGFMPLTQEITARAGIAPVRFALAPMPYTVMVTTVPEGARVTANGRNVVAPGALTLGRVTQPVLVTATHAGFDDASQTLSVGDFVAENGQMVAHLNLMLPPHVAPQAPSRPAPSRPAPSRPEPAISGNPPAPAPAANEASRPEAETPPPSRPEPETPPPAPRPEPPAPASDEPLPDNPF